VSRGAFHLCRLCGQSEIAQGTRWKNHAERVEYGCQVNELLHDCTFDRCEKPKRAHGHADDAQCHPADGACERDSAHSSADVNQFVDARE